VRGQGFTQRRGRANCVGLLTLALAVLTSALWAALALAAGPPIVSETAVSHITETSARLQATLNPNEKEVKQYFFEYVDQASFEANGFKGASKTPTGTLPSGKEGIPVSAQVDGLKSGGTYRFRLFAQNTAGKTEGPTLAFTTYVTQPPFDPCGNDALRNGASSALPDCRAYEQASPVDKNGGDLTGEVLRSKASVNGDRISFQAYVPIPGGEGSQVFTPPYLASRSAEGWSTHGLQPPQKMAQDSLVVGWTPDFSHSYSWARLFGEPNVIALLDRNNVDGSITTMVPHAAGFREPTIAGMSDDGSIVFFEFTGAPGPLPLTPEAPKERPNLFVWDRATGAYRLAGIFNDGKAPPSGSFAGPYDWMTDDPSEGGAAMSYETQNQRAIPPDGSSVYFTAGRTGQLYLRLNPTKPQSPMSGDKCTDPALACTIHVSASQKTNGPGGGPDPAGPHPAAFMGASADGSKAFFTSSEMLTNDANTGPEQAPPQIGSAEIGPSEGEEVKLDFLPTHAVGVTTFGGYIYWADPSTDTIGRAKLNGESKPTEINNEFIVPGPTKAETHPVTNPGVIESGPTKPRYVAVDSKHVYWTNSGPPGEDSFIGNPSPVVVEGGTIGRATLGPDGLPEKEKTEPEFIKGITDPRGIAVDSEHVYWVSSALVGEKNDPALGRADLEGNGVSRQYCDKEALDHTVSVSMYGVAIQGGYVYINTINTQGHDTYVEKIQPSSCELVARVFIEGDVGSVGGAVVDGSHVYWTSTREGQGKVGRANLELKEVDKEFVEVEGTLGGLANDGERLYWASNGEGAANEGNDLYRYDVETGKLTDLTPDSDPESVHGAEVQGVLGASEDGSYLYFAANGVLAEGASRGDCHGVGEAVAGTCNLYLEHEGQLSFIAKGVGLGNWRAKSKTGGGGDVPKVSRVSADGRTLLFTSDELYRYRVGDPDPILCIACNPTGLPPTGGVSFSNIKPVGFQSNSPPPVLSRYLSADGNRVFFQTSEALVPADTNGLEGCPFVDNNGGVVRACQDVYEWEAKGTGSCGWQAQNGGCLYLISTGKSDDASYLADASASGDDVFFFTRERLAAQDKDSLRDVYDARVGGGLASQNQPPPQVPCEGEACKAGATPPPVQGSPATPLFSGPGNQKPHHKKTKAKKKKKKKRHHSKKRDAKKNGRAQR
jgi:hypothetical protein